MTYSYDPCKIRDHGKDQMRFELGDTLTSGGADTCALADEEYESILGAQQSHASRPKSTQPSRSSRTSKQQKMHDCDARFQPRVEVIGRKAWLSTKLSILEAILFKLSYEVDTKIDVLSYSLSDRAKQWKTMYDQVRAQAMATAGIPVMDKRAEHKPPYFYTDIQQNKPMKQKYGEHIVESLIDRTN